MNRQELITVLYEFGLGDIEPMHNEIGICEQILDITDIATEKEAKSLFRVWPEFSGLPAYPVPGMRENLSASDAYYDIPNLWIGEYGAARRRLCVFLADQLTLNQEESK